MPEGFRPAHTSGGCEGASGYGYHLMAVNKVCLNTEYMYFCCSSSNKSTSSGVEGL